MVSTLTVRLPTQHPSFATWDTYYGYNWHGRISDTHTANESRHISKSK